MKFYQLSPQERRELLQDAGIKLEQIDQDSLAKLNQLSENVIGQIRLPLSVVQNVLINDHRYMVPMATEEPSVVAAANHGVGIFLRNGGVSATSKRDGIWGQIVLRVGLDFQKEILEKHFSQLIEMANQKFASLVRHGGGVKKIVAHQKNDLLYLRVLVDPAEAMGANKTNSILEFLASKLVSFSGVEEKLFAILSNYPSQLTTAKVKLSFQSIGGKKTAEKIVLLSQIAQDDVYRAVTNNKGIMNGVDAVLLATGNDYRAVEAASAVLASEGQYHSLSKWQIEDNCLCGQLTLPMAIGTVGGSINARQDIKQAFAILGPEVHSQELAEIITAIGLANNLAALLAISTTGIQAGHMKLQARNVVNSLEATEEEKKSVLQLMIKQKKYSQTQAAAFLKQVRKDNR